MVIFNSYVSLPEGAYDADTQFWHKKSDGYRWVSGM